METLSSQFVSTRQERIAALAKQSPQTAFTSLNHCIDLSWLPVAYERVRKDGAAGVDGQTAAEYGADLESNLRSLLDRVKSGTYKAPPVRRVHIPKGTGGDTRPIGIPTFEDKVLQRAVAMLLEAIYEQDFYPCSYGFRPGRSAHQALDVLWQQTMSTGGGWIIEVDIRKFFDTLDHASLRAFVQRRVRDGVLLRLIGKWLKAGVLEDGALTHPEAGSPQGGVISPLLANVYLHYVLDEWFAQEVKPRLRSQAFLVRYADDFVIGCTDESDARRVMEVLPKRFGRYGLTLHPEKTRLVAFRRPPQNRKGKHPEAGPRAETFDLLGFTHYWGRSRRGSWVVKRKTARSRIRRTLQGYAQWCSRNRHRPIAEQHMVLSRKLRGHMAYFGVTGNGPALSAVRHELTQIWRKWLSRRKRAGSYAWAAFNRLLARYPLPDVRLAHSVYRS